MTQPATFGDLISKIELYADERGGQHVVFLARPETHVMSHNVVLLKKPCRWAEFIKGLRVIWFLAQDVVP